MTYTYTTHIKTFLGICSPSLIKKNRHQIIITRKERTRAEGEREKGRKGGITERPFPSSKYF